MRERLRLLSEDPEYASNPYIMRPEHLAELKETFERAPTGKQRLLLWFEYAKALLDAGQSQQAIAELMKLRGTLQDQPAERPELNHQRVDLSLAIGYLRIAEEINCLTNHSPESCIFPIREAGVHTAKEAGNQAKQVLTRLLQNAPENTDARWLYNLVAMTLGEYPHEVPKPWLIEPSHFKSTANIGRFPNVADGTGLDVTGLAGGCVVDDFDNDYDYDVMVSSWDINDPIRFFINRGDGTFEDRSNHCGLNGITGGLNLIQADYDNDGWLDVLLLRGAWLGHSGAHPNSLLRNNGDGTFSDVTEAAGLLSFHPTQAAVWFDYNLDGHLDLFIGNEFRMGQAHPSELYHNNGDGTFTNRATELGLAVRQFVKGVTAGDYNNDGRPDLYLSILGSRNLLFQNNGSTYKSKEQSHYFSDITPTAGVSDPIHSFPTWFFDYNNDGHLDLFVAGYRIKGVGEFVYDYLRHPHGAELPKLFLNQGNGTFLDMTAATGLNRILLGMGANYGDLDNDGFLDFYISSGDPDLSTLTPNRMFRNDNGQAFEEITESGGFGHLQKGHGIAFGDIDNDGDQDVYAVMGGAVSGDVYRNALFQNPGHKQNWIKLKLEGTISNRSAIGARVTVTSHSTSGSRAVFRHVSSGGSFGANPLTIEVGLGGSDRIESVEVQWPGASMQQQFSGLSANRLYHLKQGEQQPRSVSLPTFSINIPASPAHHHLK